MRKSWLILLLLFIGFEGVSQVPTTIPGNIPVPGFQQQKTNSHTILNKIPQGVFSGVSPTQIEEITNLSSKFSIHVNDTSSFRKLQGYLQKNKNQPTQDGMPNGFIGNLPTLTFKGNNGMGSDIYESGIDHMSVLVPDGGYISKMPIEGFPKIQDQKSKIVELPIDSESPAIQSPLYINPKYYRKPVKPLLIPNN